MNLEGIIGLLGSQNLEKLTSQIGGTSEKWTGSCTTCNACRSE